MAERQAQTGSNTTAIIFAVFAVVCMVAFLTYRGSDVGQLQRLVGNLGGGPLVGGTQLWESLVGFVIANLILQAWVGLGRFVCSFIFPADERNGSLVLKFAISIAVGAAVWSLIWFFLGLAGVYTSTTAIIAVVAGNVLMFFRTRPITAEPKEVSMWKVFSAADWVLIAIIVVPILLALIASLAPPTAKDTLLYHFALPKAFIAQGSIAFVDGNIASYLALGAEMHSVWAMLLGGIVGPRAAEAAAGATTFMFFPVLLSAVFGWARELNVDRRFSLAAVLLVASVPTAYYVAASAYADLALALYVTLAIYALSRWWQGQETKWLVLIAIFLGAALSIKLTAVFVIAAFALIILLRARQAQDGSGNLGKILAGGFAALVLAGVIASPWYLRTWKATGSPIFPFYLSIWKGEAAGWDVERSNLFQAMNTQYGGENKNALDYLVAPWNLSVIAQPELARFFDGVLGVAFLIGLPLLIWALWKLDLAVEIKIMAGVATVMYLFWLFSSEQLRYLLPIVPLLAIAIAAAGQKIGGVVSKVVQYSLVAASACGLLTTAAWFMQKAPLRVVLGGETRDEYLARNLDYYPYYQTLNTETPADAKVWLINMRRDTYNLDRPYFSDYLFEDWTLRKMVWESRNVQELRAKAAAMNVQYVLTRHDFLFDYDRSALVDDAKPRAENEAKLKIAKDFVLDPTRTVRSDNKFSLVKVF